MRMRTGAFRRLVVAGLMTICLMAIVVSPALAHQGREDGEYTIVVGFMVEPALVEQPNGLDLRVTKGHGEGAEPVEGLETTLNAEIIYGDQRLPLTIRGRWGQPGAYTADVIPTEIGTYSFRIYGTIEGMQIDETFVGGPDTFSEVGGRNALTFPTQVERVGQVQSVASDASDSASTAMMLSIVALAIGVLGIALGGLAFVRSASAGRGATTEPVARDADN